MKMCLIHLCLKYIFILQNSSSLVIHVAIRSDGDICRILMIKWLTTKWLMINWLIMKWLMKMLTKQNIHFDKTISLFACVIGKINWIYDNQSDKCSFERRLEKQTFNSFNTYIHHWPLQRFSQDYDLVSQTETKSHTHLFCVR